MSSLADRFKRAFDPALHTKAGLSRAAKVKPPSVTSWFDGDTLSLKAEPMIRAAIYLGVSPLWLATGDGPMRSDTFRPHWPFPDVDEHLICSLDRELRLQMSGALKMLVGQQSLGQTATVTAAPGKRAASTR